MGIAIIVIAVIAAFIAIVLTGGFMLLSLLEAAFGLDSEPLEWDDNED
jgi:hypothetical protein